MQDRERLIKLIMQIIRESGLISITDIFDLLTTKYAIKPSELEVSVPFSIRDIICELRDSRKIIMNAGMKFQIPKN